MVDAIVQEIEERKAFLIEDIQTIYFGGGTPSLFSSHQLERLLKAVYDNYSVSTTAEITLEANPEDLTLAHAKSIQQLGINRLSIGIQTFDENKLKWMNRIHSSDEAREAYENCRRAEFENISLDLIYAIPDHNQDEWQKDLALIAAMNPEHISLYGLTIEDKTVFGKWERENKLVQLPEDEAASQYLFAIDYLKSKGYRQYEVSNFGKEGYHSHHNHAYWAGVPYLGVGPGAHSFDGAFTRSFNVRNNAKYLKALNEKLEYTEKEQLSEIQRINERILTELRTANGMNLKALTKLSGASIAELHSGFLKQMADQNLIELTNDNLRLLPQGFLVADEIALRLFFQEGE